MFNSNTSHTLTRTLIQYGARPAKRRCLSTHRSSIPQPPYKILFFGADKFSCVTLETLYESRKDLIQHLVVVTPPDQKTGRRLKEIHRPPLRLLAETLSLPSIALPPSLLKDWTPPSEFLPPSPSSDPPLPSSLLLTASFGHLVPNPLLSLFQPLNTLNLHPSLLPKYRGAAPIQWGIINGDADENWNSDNGMGITVQELSRGKFDRGRILGQEKIIVPENSDFLTLEPILAKKGGQLLVKILKDLPQYQENAQSQDRNFATFAPKLSKETARIDWNTMTAKQITRLQRGVGHQYPLWTTLPSTSSSSSSSSIQQQQIQLILSTTTPRFISISSVPPPPPGSLFLNPRDKSIYISTLQSSISTTGEEEEEDKMIEVVKVEKIKKEGGKWIEAKDWWNGLMNSKKSCGSILSSSSRGLNQIRLN